MQRPPHLEFKTLGVVPLDIPSGLEYKVTATTTGAVIDSHVEGDTGIVEAYVAVTGTRDEVGDVIEHYAFDRTLKSLRPKMCLGHDWNRPIGEPEEIEFLAPGHPDLPAETADGQPWPAEAGALYTKNRYMLGTQDGRDAYEHAKFFKHRTAYSIGYVVKKFRIGYHRGLKTRFIEDLDLYEYGPVLHGAHSLALQKSVKTGEPNDIESKVRKVKDSAYWGYAVGTPITANMKPRGTTARKLRAQGKVPPRDVGTTDSVTAAGKPAPKRAKVEGLAEAADANGLFPEPDDGGARVRAANPKGKDEEHVASLVDSETMFDDTPDGAKGADEQRHAAFGGLVDEGITPNELEEDLKATSWPDDVDETEKQERIADLVGEYRSRYQREARRQSSGKPVDDAAPEDAPAGDAPDAPEVLAGDGSAETGGPENAPAPTGDVDPQTPVEAAPSARKPPKVKKGEKLHTVTGANGEKFYRGSKRDYSHAVLYTDENGKQSAFSFHGSESGARGGVAEIRRRGLTGKTDITPVESDGDSSLSGPETPDKSTAAMWRRDPKRAEALLTPERRAELDAAGARTRSLYADERGRGEKHESALQRASRPLQDDDPAHITDADRLWGTDPRAASMALPSEEKNEFSLLNGSQRVRYADARTRGVPHSQAYADVSSNAPEAPAEDVNAPDANASAVAAPDIPGTPAATEPDVPTAPDAEAAPETPEAPGKPSIQALANSAAMDNDLSHVSTEDLKAVDAEMAKRAEMLGHPDEVTKVHQQIKDMIAGREDGSLPEPDAAAPEAPTAPDAPDVSADGAAPDAAVPEVLPAPGAEGADAPEAAPAVATGDLSKTQSMSDEQLAAELAKAQADFDAVRDQPRTSNTYTEAKLSVDQLTTEQRRREQGGAVEPGDAPSETAPPLDGAPDDASELAIPGADVTPSAETVNSPAPPPLDKRTVISAATLGQPERIAPLLTASYPEAYADGTNTAEGDAAALVAARAPALVLMDIEERNQRKQDAAAHREPSATDEAAETLDPATTAQLNADDIAEANATADASFGITEADDGAFEVDTDVSDRQERVSALLDANEEGRLDLTSRTDDGLRATRADVVNELKLQDHLADRGDGTPASTRRQRGNSSSASESDGSDTGDTTPPGPKTRPGVAGAAEDLADALEGTDAEAIVSARARLESSLRRSKSDSEVVHALRALIETGQQDIDPVLLRTAAEHLRIEARNRRNEQARNRRTAKRLDRDRLRSLLGSVDAEMRRRNLSFDPVPGLDAEDTGTSASVATGSTTAGTWQASTVPWSGAAATQVNGTGYSGHVETLNGRTRYQWAATGPDGTELASGSGTMSDPETARTAVAHALAAQQTLGRIPSDSVLPPTPANDSPAQRQQAERSGTEAIRARIDDSSVNPITGKPNPLAPPSGLKTLGTPVFASPAAVRAHLDASTVDRAGNPNAAGDIRWDDVKLTPGGGMAVGTNLRGEPVLFHTGSGASIPPTINGKTLPMNKSDLLKMATIMEALPDADGNVIDFSDPDRRALGAAILNWRSADGDTNNMGLALVNVAARSIVAEKLRAGKWSDPVVKQVRMSATAGDGTNPTRRAHLDDLHRTLGQMANVRSGKVPTEDKKTLDIARAARELSDAGAPDAAAVVLRRRAAELRDLGAKADEAVATAKTEGLDRPNLSTRANDFKVSLRMADVLDDLAAGHLSMHSPAPSPGERAIRLQPGERIAFPEGDGVRTYRVLSPMRSLEGGTADSSYAQVVDETTGQQLTAAIIGGSNMSPNFQVYDPDVKVGIFHGTAHATPLGGNGFAVLDADEPAPASDGFKAAGYANISAIPAEALDRAAGELPETKAETAARRAATPDGVRAPARRSTAAPRRSAPAARVAPDDREQALAQSQTTALNLWQKAPFETADAAPAGGFKDFSEVQAAALARYQNWQPGADERYRSSLQSLTVDDAGSEGSGNYNLGTGGAKLSPGGHFIVRKDGSIVHAHTGLIAWNASSARKWGIDDIETPSPALAMRIADYLERGDIGGNSVNWVTNDPDAIIESAKTVTEQSGGINPMATITKAAYLDHAAVTPRMTASDITSVTSLTSSATPESYVPNTDLLTGLLIGDTENSYNALGGKRTSAMVLSKAEDIPAISGSKEGQTLAKRVAGEYALTRGQAKVAPLDAVRRLNALADELDGRTIESTDGKTFTPSDDLRARAQAITDAFDETKPSPMGMLARNNFDATIAPDLSKADISVGQVLSGGWGGSSGANEGSRNVRTARLKTELREGGTIKMERGESGNLRATLGGRTVEDGVDGGKVSTNANGSIEVSWREDLYGGAAEPKVRLPAGTWKLDGGGPAASTGGGISDADYEAHTAQIEEKLGEALSNGEATDRTMTLGQDGQSWTPERAKLHNEIIDELWQTNGASVPTEGKAVIAGGLGGAGKSTVLKGYAGIDATQYFTINPDDVKEAMAARDMIPKVEGLSSMEASPLVHEESSHIANLLGARAYANNTNVVWDITMSREASVKRRAAEMRKAGYTDISGVYVDIPIETSVERALARHRQGLDQANAGNGNGGRYVPPALIRAMSSDQASSINRETFDKLKTQFDSWVIYDNAVAGREPKKIAGVGQWGGENQTVPVAPKAPEPPAPEAI